MTDQKTRADQFRQLHHGPNILVLPNAWDAGSARVFEHAGFGAIGTSSAGLANALGYGDGEQIPRDEMLFMVRRIAHTVNVPVSADIEAGFGRTTAEVVETVRGVIEAGAVGINLEDSSRSGRSGLLDIVEQVELIAAVI